MYKEILNKSGISYFDVNGWFINLKDSLNAPLFPKTGTHWSHYGAMITSDSLLKKCEHILSTQINQLIFKDIEWTVNPQSMDKDLEDLSNLIFPIKQDKQLAYPVFIKENVIKKENRPTAIVVGDSFFWNIYNYATDSSFKQINFWYYYNSVFPQWENHHPTVKDIDVLDKLRRVDIAMIIVSTAGLHKFGYGFINDVYQKINEETGSLSLE